MLAAKIIRLSREGFIERFRWIHRHAANEIPHARILLGRSFLVRTALWMMVRVIHIDSPCFLRIQTRVGVGMSVPWQVAAVSSGSCFMRCLAQIFASISVICTDANQSAWFLRA
jgi:hypothetical protein